MTEDHWKLARMSGLLWCSFTFLLLLRLEGCQGQDGGNPSGANFFYYYSPTQRTMVNHGGALPSGNIFNNPFLQQQQLQIQPTLPPFGLQQQQQQQQAQQQQPAIPNLQLSSPASPLLGYQPQPTPVANIFSTQQPLGQLQFQQFGQQQQQNPIQPNSAFSPFTQFGNIFANQNAGFGQQYLQPTAPTLPPQLQQQQQQQKPGSLSFFQSPFQFVQQRFLQNSPTPTVPAPEQPLPATTVAPTLPPAPASQATLTVAPRRKKISSRFRYVQPTVQYEYNPYTRLVTPITSTLPFTEERFYSTVVPSVPTPTGYSFSLGDGTGSTSSVHVSMGPLTNRIQQHLTEITQLRRISQKRRKPEIYLDQLAVENLVKDPVDGEPAAAGSMMQMFQDAPVMEATSEIAPPAPEAPSPSPTPEIEALANMTSTVDTLLNEPSFQMETVVEPATPASDALLSSVVELEASAKINSTNIPRRLAIRKKVARKRLRLDGAEVEAPQGRSVDGAGVAVSGRRRMGGLRRISQNRLSVDEPAKEYEGPQNGLVGESSPEVNNASSTTTSSPVLESFSNESMPDEQPHSPEEVEQPSSSTTAQPQQEKIPSQPTQVPEMPQVSSTSTELPQSQEVPSEEQEKPEAMIAPIENIAQEMQEPMPFTTTAASLPSSTTSAPVIEPEEDQQLLVSSSESPAPAMPMEDEPKQDDYYYDEYDTPSREQPNTITGSQQAPALTSGTASDSSSKSSSGELPVLDDAKEEDFPAVFRSSSPTSNDKDNSVESDQGEVITRYKSSQPATEIEDTADAPSPLVSTSAPSTTTTTTEADSSAQFVNNDPPEEQPPATSGEVEEPVFQPLTEHTPTTSTTTASTPALSTTTALAPENDMGDSSSSSSSEEEMGDSYEDDDEAGSDSRERAQSSSSTTEAPKEEVNDATMPSSTESSPEMPQNEEEIRMPAQPVSSTSAEKIDDNNDDIKEDILSSSTAPSSPMFSSSTTKESPPQSDEVSPSSQSSQVSSSTPPPSEEDINEEQTVSSSTTVAPLPSPSTTEFPEAGEEDFPQSNESSQSSSSESQELSQSEEGDKLTYDEVIGKAQRLTLEETLRRLREKQQQTTESVDLDENDENNNATQTDTQPKRRLRNFVRRPLQLANLSLPTSPPLTNINAVLGDEDRGNRREALQKIQKFRATLRTTTKRPRRVTRPSSTERLPNPDLDSYSDSSSSTSGPVEISSTYPTSLIAPITTTETPARTELTSTTEAVTTVEPTTTTTTTSTSSTETLTTTDQARMTTLSTTSTASTTTVDDFSETDDGDVTMTYDEDDHVYYDEDNHDSTVSSSTTIASSTGGKMYTTPSSTTKTSSTEGPFMTATEFVEPEMSTESATFSTTSTDIPLATTTTAGQLIIHEILPTMPPLKEVSFVIGESVEEDQIIQSKEEKQPLPEEKKAVVRVETKVKVSSSVESEDSQQSSSQQVSSEEASIESSPSSTPSSSFSSSVETTGSGRKVRVVIRRQRMRQGRNANGTRTTSQENQRRRRKVLHKQLRRRS